MNFELSDDQKMLRDTAIAFVKKESPVERLRRTMESDLGYERRIYAKMGELGWLGVPFAEELGGYGGSFVDAAIILEQLGRSLVPEPYATAVVAGMTLARYASPAQCERWLAPLCRGELVPALALAERQSRFDVTDVETRAERDGGGYRLSGRKVFVVDGYDADLWLVSARTGGGTRDAQGVSLFAVPRDAEGVAVTRVQTLDGRRAAMLALDGVAVGADSAIGGVDQAAATLEDAVDLGAAAACAEGLGVQRAALEMTLDYLKTREQFGVAIGSFQALQHRAVDMFVDVELSSSLSVEANIRLGDDSSIDERRAAVSAAKVQLATGGKRVTQQAIQLMGGIAITEEHDAGLYFKRMHALNTIFGDEEHHVARLAALPSFTQGLEA